MNVIPLQRYSLYLSLILQTSIYSNVCMCNSERLLYRGVVWSFRDKTMLWFCEPWASLLQSCTETLNPRLLQMDCPSLYCMLCFMHYATFSFFLNSLWISSHSFYSVYLLFFICVKISLMKNVFLQSDNMRQEAKRSRLWYSIHNVCILHFSIHLLI